MRRTQTEQLLEFFDPSRSEERDSVAEVPAQREGVDDGDCRSIVSLDAFGKVVGPTPSHFSKVFPRQKQRSRPAAIRFRRHHGAAGEPCCATDIDPSGTETFRVILMPMGLNGNRFKPRTGVIDCPDCHA